MAQDYSTVLIQPTTVSDLTVTVVGTSGTHNLSLTDFSPSLDGQYLEWNTDDEITSATVFSTGYKFASWSGSPKWQTAIIRLEGNPNPVIREISVDGIVYDIDAKGISDIAAHRVVGFQIPTAGNGYTWYRKYADGWVEQGGIISGNYSGTITYPVEMANTEYFVSTSLITNRGAASFDRELFPNTLTTTGMTLVNFSGGVNRPGRWQVSGMAK